MSGNKWDHKYLDMAALVGSWSKDPSSKVGAVIVKSNRVIATGFNGFPSAVEDKEEWLSVRKVKYEMVVHAEVNALIVAGQRAEGATIYVSGRPVCSSCAGAIIQAGIKRVVAPAPAQLAGGFKAAVRMLKDANSGELENSIWEIKGLVAQHMFSDARLSFDSHPHSCWNAKMETATTLTTLPPKAANDRNSSSDDRKTSVRRTRSDGTRGAAKRQARKTYGRARSR